MRVTDSLLDSRGEQKLYSVLATTFNGLSGGFVPQISFSQLFDASRAEIANLAPKDMHDPFGWYLMSDVDLTFCEGRDHRPVFSIEFDGLTKGFSRNGSFVPAPESPDPRLAAERAAKLDLKVRMAREAEYPLIVIGWDELAAVGKNEFLTIIDGLAAEILAPLIAGRRLDDGWEPEPLEVSEVSEPDPVARAAIESAWRSHSAGEEVRAEIDPFVRASKLLELELTALGELWEETTFSFEPPVTADRRDVRATVRAEQAARFVVATAEAGVGDLRTTQRSRMRNLWAPLTASAKLVPAAIRNSPDFAMTGPPIAKNVTKRVARYLALLDLLDQATSSGDDPRAA